MVMAPPLALLLGPRVTVVVVLLLEGVAAAPMLSDALRQARRRLIAPICVAACLTAPLGSQLLARLDPMTMRRIIAALVLVLGMVLLSGLRYRGTQRLSTSLAMGSLSGLLAGATSVGGPPVILYLLAGPDPVAVTRANLALFITVISLAGLAGLTLGGVVTGATLLLGALAAPVYILGIRAGTRVFPRVDDVLFRRLALFMLIAVSALVLLA
jgi:uncharacterized membrane protein YfcA